MWDLMILLLRQKNRPDGSDIAELLCPFDKQSQQSFYKNQTAKNNQNNTAAVVESGNVDPLFFGQKNYKGLFFISKLKEI